ncbi:hypothetical protein ACFQ08_21910 [Streptosporangium algeriense]|uniref:SRPBCC family protein n=1 Tax=Streptosporangium algeriense TaxID=1682748 RepID=A0ABW3DTW1_9ACTN
MAYGEARVLVRRTAGEVLDFVMDPRAYAVVDDKIGAVRWVRREGNAVTFRFRARILGLPGPLTSHRMVRTGDERVDITPVPSWQERLCHFQAFFVCVPHAEGAVVTRRLEFGLVRPLSWLAAPLTRWLRREVPAELAAAKAWLERTGA